MKKIFTLASAAALALAAAVPATAQSATNSDPFVSTQEQGSILMIGGVQYVVLAVVAAGLIVALADSDSSTTTLIPAPS